MATAKAKAKAKAKSKATAKAKAAAKTADAKKQPKAKASPKRRRGKKAAKTEAAEAAEVPEAAEEAEMEEGAEAEMGLASAKRKLFEDEIEEGGMALKKPASKKAKGPDGGARNGDAPDAKGKSKGKGRGAGRGKGRGKGKSGQSGDEPDLTSEEMQKTFLEGMRVNDGCSFEDVKINLVRNNPLIIGKAQLSVYWSRAAVGLKLLIQVGCPQVAYFAFKAPEGVSDAWNKQMTVSFISATLMASRWHIIILNIPQLQIDDIIQTFPLFGMSMSSHQFCPSF